MCVCVDMHSIVWVCGGFCSCNAIDTVPMANALKVSLPTGPYLFAPLRAF